MVPATVHMGDCRANGNDNKMTMIVTRPGNATKTHQKGDDRYNTGQRKGARWYCMSLH
jgi:hypothetical protein